MILSPVLSLGNSSPMLNPDPKFWLLPQRVHCRVSMPVKFWVQNLEIVRKVQLAQDRIEFHPRQTVHVVSIIQQPLFPKFKLCILST